MRVRRRIVNFIRKIVFGVVFVGFNLFFVSLGLFLPDLLAFTGISQFHLRVAGFFVILLVIMFSIALFEVLDNV